jgi:hypothetical protein
VLEQLRELAIPHDHHLGPNRQATHLWVSTPEIDLVDRWCDVVLLDCTYRTNLHDMPLLEIVGVTALDTSFTIGAVLIASEAELDYDWALVRLRRLLNNRAPAVILTDRDFALMSAVEANFPEAKHMLCIWHINKNVMAQAKTTFRQDDRCQSFMKLWMAVCYASTETDYLAAVTALHTADEADDWAIVFQYVQNTWLQHHQRFVAAWTSRHPHLGNAATSRVEGAHHTFKSMIQTRKCTIDTVGQSLLALFRRQAHETRTAIASEGIRTIALATSVRKLKEDDAAVFRVAELFQNLIYKVAHHVLLELLEQLRRLERAEELPPCTGYHGTVKGMPCAHAIAQCIATGQPLQLRDVAARWHLRPQALLPVPPLTARLQPPPSDGPVLNPPMGRESGTTTKRRKTAAEKALQPVRHCSRCHAVGHNVLKCPLERAPSTQP